MRMKHGQAGVAAVPERGEHMLTLGDRAYRLRPSFSAIRTIEEKTGKALLELVRIGNTGAMPLAMAAQTAVGLIRAGADDDDRMTRAVTADRIGELIFEQGIPGVTARLTLCLLDAATGGRDAAGEVKAVAETNEEEATAD